MKRPAHRSSVLRLLILPGMDGSGELLAPFVEALGGRMETTVLTYPVQPAMGYHALAELLAGSLPEEDFLLLGESFGGPLTLMLAARQPAGLRGAVLAASFARYPQRLLAWLPAHLPWTPPPRLLPAALLRSLLMEGAATELEARVAEVLARLPMATLRTRLREVVAVDAREQLAAIKVPLLLLEASRDRLVSRAAACEIQASLPSAVVQRIEGPHFLLQCAARDCAERVLAWANGLLQTAS